MNNINFLEKLSNLGMTKKLMFESIRSQNFHRHREHQAPGPDEQPLNKIKFYLDKYKIKEALQVFFNERTQALMRDEWDDGDFIWELIPVICKRLRGLCRYRFRVFEGCEKMLDRIATDEYCNPKEVLIVFLAEITQANDDTNDDNVLRAMMRPLELVLHRMKQPTPRNENLKWVISVLLNYVQCIETPEDSPDPDAMERAKLSNHPRSKRFVQILPSIIGLIDEFSERPKRSDSIPPPPTDITEEHILEPTNEEFVDISTSTTHGNQSINNELSEICSSAISSLMLRPFNTLDLTKERMEFRVMSNRCLLLLLTLRPNYFSPIYKNINSSKPVNIHEEATLSLATCAYIYRCCWLGLSVGEEHFPRMLRNEAILYRHIPYVASLLECPESLAIEKGLTLFESLLKPLEKDSMDEGLLRQLDGGVLIDRTLYHAIHANLNTNRRIAFEIFTLICDLLNYETKVKFLRDVLTQDHLRPSMRAACIDLYRRHLAQAYRTLVDHEQMMKKEATEFETEDTDPSAKQTIQNRGDYKMEFLKALKAYESMTGHVLVDFLRPCLKSCLPDTNRVEIFENYDLFMATINFLRFLKLRNPVMVKDVESDFLDGQNLKVNFFEHVRIQLTHTKNELKAYSDLTKKRSDKTTDENKQQSNDDQENTQINLISKMMKLFRQGSRGKQSKDGKCPDDHKCIGWILCRLDLMSSVLVRTSDLYNV